MTGSIVSFLLLFTFTENQLKTREKEIKLFFSFTTNVIIISVYQFIFSVRRGISLDIQKPFEF